MSSLWPRAILVKAINRLDRLGINRLSRSIFGEISDDEARFFFLFLHLKSLCPHYIIFFKTFSPLGFRSYWTRTDRGNWYRRCYPSQSPWIKPQYFRPPGFVGSICASIFAVFCHGVAPLSLHRFLSPEGSMCVAIKNSVICEGFAGLV